MPMTRFLVATAARVQPSYLIPFSPNEGASEIPPRQTDDYALALLEIEKTEAGFAARPADVGQDKRLLVKRQLRSKIAQALQSHELDPAEFNRITKQVNSHREFRHQGRQIMMQKRIGF